METKRSRGILVLASILIISGIFIVFDMRHIIKAIDKLNMYLAILLI